VASRVDRATRLIKAAPATIYSALIDPEALISWLPPRGMSATIEHFDARPGGRYRMVLTYDAESGASAAKSRANADIVEGEFVRLERNREVAQKVEFESDDPAYAGAMTMTWRLEPASDGTQVSIVAEDVPSGISAEDHTAGMASSLENLAAYCEAE
jgi:uncharacterized protein YndB with AHSA1/START domain